MIMRFATALSLCAGLCAFSSFAVGAESTFPQTYAPAEPQKTPPVCVLHDLAPADLCNSVTYGGIAALGFKTLEKSYKMTAEEMYGKLQGPLGEFFASKATPIAIKISKSQALRGPLRVVTYLALGAWAVSAVTNRATAAEPGTASTRRTGRL